MVFGPSRRLPSETLFRIAEHQYRTMLEDGSWTIAGKKAFQYNTESQGAATEAQARPLPP
jgi:hypothetical protein